MFKDFIGHYPSVIDRKSCNAAIASLESQRFIAGKLESRERRLGPGTAHLISDLAVDMKEVELTYVSSEISEVFGNLNCNLHDVIQQKVEEYMSEYSISNQHGGTLANMFFKMQMTRVGESFSKWHTEWATEYPNRFLVWMLYLNDIMEGGETEWLYYNRRIQPRAGDLLIWPTGFTHAHRGNPPLDKKKYVITGWITAH